MLTRRGFLSGAVLALAAPAIVHADNLMRVRGIIVPRSVLMWAPHNYSFSAWVRAETVPASVQLLDNSTLMAKTFTVACEWTRIHMDGLGALPALSVSPANTTVQTYAAQLERA